MKRKNSILSPTMPCKSGDLEGLPEYEETEVQEELEDEVKLFKNGDLESSSFDLSDCVLDSGYTGSRSSTSIMQGRDLSIKRVEIFVDHKLRCVAKRKSVIKAAKKTRKKSKKHLKVVDTDISKLEKTLQKN